MLQPFSSIKSIYFYIGIFAWAIIVMQLFPDHGACQDVANRIVAITSKNAADHCEIRISGEKIGRAHV